MEHIFDTRPVTLSPWHVDRTDERHPRIVNISDKIAPFVRAIIDDERRVHPTQFCGALAPGASAELDLCGINLDAATITVVWQGDDGVDLLWQFVM